MTTGSAVHYRFHHRHLIVADVAKTVAFYEGTLGAKKVQEMEFHGIPIVRLESRRHAAHHLATDSRWGG